MSELDRLTHLVEQRAAALVLYARQWLGDDASAAAEDVVQEALTALLVRRYGVEEPVAWMYRAVRNAAIDHARSARRRRKRERLVAESRREWFESRHDTPLDAQAAEQALRGLSPHQRELVVLRIWGGLGFSQIAQIVQLSVSTVHDQYSSALAQMRSALEEPSCRNKSTQ